LERAGKDREQAVERKQAVRSKQRKKRIISGGQAVKSGCK
jgi:hypothetical protein